MFDKDQTPKDVLTRIFDDLNENDLKNVKLVSKFWKSCADATAISKNLFATRWLIKHVKDGNEKGVLSAIQQGANVNVKTKDYNSYASFSNGNLLHTIIFEVAGWRNILNIGINSYQKIFKTLIQHGINIKHQASITSIPDGYDVLRTPFQQLYGDFKNNTFMALLHLRELELSLRPLKREAIKKIIDSVGELSLETLRDYCEKLDKNDTGFVHRYKNEEARFISEYGKRLFEQENTKSHCIIS